jgi:beta-lactamase class A
MSLPITKKTSLIITLISLGLTNLATYYYTNKENKEAAVEKATEESINSYGNSSCSVKVQRLNGYDYIKPVLFVDKVCEGDKLNPIKQSVTSLIEEHKRLGTITSASVYIKEYASNEWTGVNTDEKFLPGSLMKVPELICVLKMEEANPGFLNKTLTYNKAYNLDKHPRYLSKNAIKIGQSYTVKELLTYMIAYSDNNATSLLFENLDQAVFKKIFSDMGLPPIDFTAQNYPITAKDFSIFMRVLYNSSYLTNKHSEFATELLGKCNFKDGLVSGLPSSVKVAHKFGESGDPLHFELSESAIVYLNNSPYVLTIMTKGAAYDKLPGVIKQISESVYKQMDETAKTTL